MRSPRRLSSERHSYSLTWDIKPIASPKVNTNLLFVVSLILLLTMAFMMGHPALASHCDQIVLELGLAAAREKSVNIENERAKEKKHVWRNYIRATMFLVTLLFLVIGILFYMLIPDLQISPGTEKSLLLIVSILSLAALFAWIFWHRPARKRYTKEYKEELEKSKISIFLNGRAFRVCQFLMILLALGVGWYIGHHRPAQKLLNAEPVKEYKTVTPLPPQTPISNTRATPTPTDAHEAEDTSVTPFIPDEENTDANSLNPEHSDLPGQVVQSGDTPVSQKETEHEHAHSKEEQEASKQAKAEAEKAVENAKQAQKEALEMMREVMPTVANYLNTLSTEEQTKMLREIKTKMSDQISQYPPELLSLIEKHDVVGEGWKMYLDMLAEAGYTPPRNFE